MPIFAKESLENLRGKVDLIELLQSHMELKPSGATYKGLCPFHEEKTPSFMVQRGDTHYHCFGCGAHGDAIQFLMNHLHLSFQEAVLHLAERFQVQMETTDTLGEARGPSPAKLKEALAFACDYYQEKLQESQEAKEYLSGRCMDASFLEQFKIGYAPTQTGELTARLKKRGVSDEVLLSCGLLKQGSRKEFFFDRIMFPIHDAMGSVIGFSGRKLREETFGGKYVNTPETPIFKKSRTLFGLNYCRKEIAKKKRAIIVEGQVDALKLIHAGIKYAVAAQGTAFGKEHVDLLEKLGVTRVLLAMDGDMAGLEAQAKSGHLFLKSGIDVQVALMPQGKDPDAILTSEGKEGFKRLLEGRLDYLTWLYRWKVEKVDLSSPAQKQQLVTKFVQLIRTFKDDVLVHESLKKLSELASVPAHLLGLEKRENYFRQQGSAVGIKVEVERVLEEDFLRILLFSRREEFLTLAKQHLSLDGFMDPTCREIYEKILDGTSFLELVEEPSVQEFVHSLEKKHVDRKSPEKYFKETLQKILERNWINKRETLNKKIHQDQENMELLKEYAEVTSNPPKVYG